MSSAGDVFAQAFHGPPLPQPLPALAADEIGALYDRVMATTGRHIDQCIRGSKQRLIDAGKEGEDALWSAVGDLREEIAGAYRSVFETLLPGVLGLAPFYEATRAPRGVTAEISFSESHPALYAFDLIDELLVDAGIDTALDGLTESVALAPETGRNWDKVYRDLDRLTELKRHEDLRPALALALQLVSDVEALTPSEYPREIPPPHFTEQAAIIYRKMKDYDGEVAIIERYERLAKGRGIALRHRSEDLIKKRLPKARALRDKHASM